MHGPHGCVAALCEQAGAGKVVFGSLAPLQYIGSSLLKVRGAIDLPHHFQPLVLEANLRRVLGLPDDPTKKAQESA